MRDPMLTRAPCAAARTASLAVMTRVCFTMLRINSFCTSPSTLLM